MHFKLCFKSYEYKPSLKSMKEFKEATGLDLWSSLAKYMVEFSKARLDGCSVSETLHRLAEVLDFVNCAQLFYCLAKQESKSLTINEIEDAMYNAGILPSERDDDMSEPYPFVMYALALQVQEYHNSLAKDLKKK